MFGLLFVVLPGFFASKCDNAPAESEADAQLR